MVQGSAMGFNPAPPRGILHPGVAPPRPDEQASMESQTPASPGRRPSTMGWLEYVIGGAAVAVSAISLQVALNANQTQERLLAASTWPHVQYGTGNRLDDGTPAITLSLANAGVGPARVHSVRLRHEGVVMPDADALLRACCTPGAGNLTTITSDPVQVLVPGDSTIFLRYDRAGPDDPVFTALNRVRWNVEVEVCYCSVLDDCWMLVTRPRETQPREPTPIKQCPVVPFEERYKG